jgi:hypothetical protein
MRSKGQDGTTYLHNVTLADCGVSDSIIMGTAPTESRWLLNSVEVLSLSHYRLPCFSGFGIWLNTAIFMDKDKAR